MKEHVVVDYEAFDGKFFDDEMECIKYEMNAMYEQSGIRFFDTEGKEMKELEIDNDESYNMVDIITIDRSREKENERFIENAIYLCGWALLDELKFGTCEKYRVQMDEIVPIE